MVVSLGIIACLVYWLSFCPISEAPQHGAARRLVTSPSQQQLSCCQEFHQTCPQPPQVSFSYLSSTVKATETVGDSVFLMFVLSSASPLCSITPPKPPVFEGTLNSDASPASEEKGMSIPVIGSSECTRRSSKLKSPRLSKIFLNLPLLIDVNENHEMLLRNIYTDQLLDLLHYQAAACII